MSSISRRSTPPAAADRLVRALRGLLGEDLDVESIESRNWSSITFSGERHRLRLRLSAPAGEAAAAWIDARLADAEPEIRGHVLIDLSVTGLHEGEPDGKLRLDLEAVTLESP